jgi:chromate transporter
MPPKSTLREIASLFLKLGSISFGGPAAHTAMMENEVVRKKKWMDHGHFLDLVGATNLIPGPNSTEMTMHCGFERAGFKGLIVAGLSFMIPAVAITMAFAWVYQEFGHLPDVEAFIYGIKPAVIAIIVSAMIPLAKKAFKSTELIILGVATLAACLLGLSEIIALFACGGAGILLYLAKNSRKSAGSFFPVILLQAVTATSAVPLVKIFWIFLKVGAILYGSGYVLFAFLDAELVSRELITTQQLMDAIAVGQLTPGPILSAATFIGWQMAGFPGALLATAGIFLPSFLFVAILNPLIPKLRKSGFLSAFLDAVNVASVAVILAVAVEMGKATLTDWRTIVIAVGSILALLVFKKVNSAVVVIGGAVAGFILNLV